LKGKTAGADGQYKEDDESYITKSKLAPFFKDSCHKGFIPSADNNFFQVYDALFRKLDHEEEMEEAVGTKHFKAAPFGLHYACMEDVFAFYEHWQFFTTAKQFTFADVYNPAEAPNRRVKRLIEAENKKERQKERVKFNDLVRQLITQLMDKDPRYRKFKLQ
jgi:DnaJ family protein A protein 5